MFIVNLSLQLNYTISDEWVERNNKYYYYDLNGEIVSDCWCEIDNEWYYFEKNGEMQQDKWISSDTDLYYVGCDGIMYRNKWLYQNNSSGGYWYAKNGNCYHEKYGCSGATLPYPPKNKSYRACSKCSR